MYFLVEKLIITCCKITTKNINFAVILVSIKKHLRQKSIILSTILGNLVKNEHGEYKYRKPLMYRDPSDLIIRHLKGFFVLNN